MEVVHISRISTLKMLKALCYQGSVPYLLIGIPVLLTAQAPRPMHWREMIEVLYADDINGGPLWARGVISATICKLRKRGVAIHTAWGRGYYMLRDAA